MDNLIKQLIKQSESKEPFTRKCHLCGVEADHRKLLNGMCNRYMCGLCCLVLG